jgi:hypothetical protein
MLTMDIIREGGCAEKAEVKNRFNETCDWISVGQTSNMLKTEERVSINPVNPMQSIRQKVSPHF